MATVSNGTVTAKKAGTATITVKSNNGKKATCKVTVKELDRATKILNAAEAVKNIVEDNKPPINKIAKLCGFAVSKKGGTALKY